MNRGTLTGERRLAQRIAVYRPLRIHRHAGQRLVETLTKDLSSGGLRCLSPDPIPVASELTIDLVLSDRDEPLRLSARSVWFQNVPNSDQFEIGIAFHDVEPQHKRRLSTYLSHLSSKLSI